MAISMKCKMDARNADERGAGALFELKVVVVPDEDAFFAQGFDVDYFASGATREEAEENFRLGLEKMVAVHLKKFGNLDRLVPASVKVRAEYIKYATMNPQHTKTHVLKMASQFPFERVQYFAF